MVSCEERYCLISLKYYKLIKKGLAETSPFFIISLNYCEKICIDNTNYRSVVTHMGLDHALFPFFWLTII